MWICTVYKSGFKKPNDLKAFRTTKIIDIVYFFKTSLWKVFFLVPFSLLYSHHATFHSSGWLPRPIYKFTMRNLRLNTFTYTSNQISSNVVGVLHPWGCSRIPLIRASNHRHHSPSLHERAFLISSLWDTWLGKDSQVSQNKDIKDVLKLLKWTRQFDVESHP